MPFNALLSNAENRDGVMLPSNAQLERYRTVREQTEDLVAGLSAEDCTAQSMPECSPVKWHLAHTSWFFETFVLVPGVPDYERFNSAFHSLFNSFYNQVGEPYPRRLRGLITRPALDEVFAYRTHVDRAMIRLLQTGVGLTTETVERIELGINNEQQRQERMLADLKHLFSCSPLYPIYRETQDVLTTTPDDLEWIHYEEGLRQIGFGDAGFAFDNELPRHRVFVDAFELASRPVTTAEYLAFIEDGGYTDAGLWLSNAWKKVQNENWTSPAYWVKQDGAWMHYTLGGLKPLRLDQPVTHISLYEANAYARWANARLPTEAEWEVAATGLPIEGNFMESAHYQPIPSPANRPHPVDLYGNIWEWTQSPYSPYPGFQAADGAMGEYNAKFMCDQYVLKGGSCATAESHIRPSYRHYQPADARWQFAGLRLARDLNR